MLEIWKPIPGFDGYEASSLGRVRSLKRGTSRILRPGRSREYLMVVLYEHKKPRARRLHRVITETFLGPCPRGKETNHKNGQKLDNRLENLEYCTRSENVIHAYRNLGFRSARGIAHGMAQLSEQSVKEIRELRSAGASQNALAHQFGISQAHVWRIIHCKAWRHL